MPVDDDARAGHIVAGAVSAKWAKGTGGPAGDECYNLTLAHAPRADGFDASEDGTGRGTPLVPCAFDARQSDLITYGNQAGPLDTDGHSIAIAFDTTQVTNPDNRSNPQPGDPCHPLAAGAHPPAIAFSAKDHGADAGDIAPTLRAGGHTSSHANGGVMPAVAFQTSQSGVREHETHATLDANNGSRRHNGVVSNMTVRRLTPRECERLQGFPDDYTLIPYRGKLAADGPRYKALGNSMAVPVMAWVGRRIQLVETLTADLQEGLNR